MGIQACRYAYAVALLVAAAPRLHAQTRFPGAHWDSAPNPAALGWDTAGLTRARAYADSIGTVALMIVRDGIVVAQWGDVARRLHAFSVRKSLQSALMGIAVSRGVLDTNATLAGLGIDDDPPLSEAERTARVVDLLTARSGVYHPAAYETPGMRNNRPARGSHLPGTYWFYSNWDFNAVGTIYERAVKRSIFDAFLEEIAVPIGMEDLRREDMEYFREPASQHPAYLFRMSARDLARFGWLYLNDGAWDGRQIVPKEWVRWSTRPLADARILGGYGAMWWVATNPNDPVLGVPVGTFSARGTGEQDVFVFPPWRMVIVHRGDPRQRMIRVTEFGRLLRMILAVRGA